MAYRTRFIPKNLKKYHGSTKKIVCRSNWERQLAKWCDKNPKIHRWNMEQVIIPYTDRGTGKRRRYFVDFWIEFKDGEIYLIEVKPYKQTKPPVKRKRKTRRYLNEVMTWATNVSKWEAAERFCELRGWHFEKWTENELKRLGLRIIS